jgi:hypothetical protein
LFIKNHFSEKRKKNHNFFKSNTKKLKTDSFKREKIEKLNNIILRVFKKELKEKKSKEK